MRLAKVDLVLISVVDLDSIRPFVSSERGSMCDQAGCVL